MINVEINIVEILKSRIALHEFGKPIKKILNEKLAEVRSPTLFILNLTKANPMDYEFVRISFNEIIEANKTNPNVFIVFKVDKYEFEELCMGILDILQLKIEKGTSEEDVLRQHNFSMIYVTGNDETKYLSNLSENHILILTEIENNVNIDSTIIQSKFPLRAEEVSSILDDLLARKFIVRTEDYKYQAVKYFI